MSTGLQLPRKEVLRIGYVRTTSPYDLPCTVNAETIMMCRKVGVVGEILKTIALTLNYELRFVQTDDYGDQPNGDGQWPGLTGMLINGTIDATTGLWLTTELMQVIKFTVPIASTDTGIVAGRLLSANADAPMDFTVFSKDIYLVFLSVILVVAVVLKTAHSDYSLLECVWRSFSIIMWKHKDRALHPLLLIGLLLFVLGYFANFRGKLLISALQTVEPTLEIEQELRNGRLRLIARHPAILKADLLQEIYGTVDPYHQSSFSPLIEPSNARIVELLCEHANVIYYGDILALFSGDQPQQRQCQLSRVKLDSASKLGFSAQWGLGIRPSFDSKRLSIINGIIQRAFSPDMLNNYYFKQYSSAAATDPDAAPVQPDSNQIIGLAQLRFAFYFYCVGMCVAVLSAVIEKLWGRKQRIYYFNGGERLVTSDNWSTCSIPTYRY